MKSFKILLIPFLAVCVFLASVASPLSAAPLTQINEGQKCGKLNRITSDGLVFFQCVKKGRLKVWQVKGVVPSSSTTVPQKTRTTQVANLQEFVSTYGKSVVTIYCGGSSGSGVSVPFGVGVWHQELGAQSVIATNMHVVEDCINSGTFWRDNLVTILHQGVEYVGYVNSWPSYVDYLSGAKADLASVMTTGLVPSTSYWNVRAPQLGDAVVAIGSAGGVPNIATRGEVAGVTAKDIISTAPAGHGSSGGALFNNNGQLLGFIYAANASLVNVVPTPRLCESVFSCSTPIVYVP
jgi:S1-C subfamily serine protease